MHQVGTRYNSRTWIGHTADGQRIYSSLGVVSPIYDWDSAEERAAFDAETARKVAALGSYALSNPEVPVHDTPY